MSSLSDMMSAALAGLLSAALVHFGANDGAEKPQKPRPAAQRTMEKPRAAPEESSHTRAASADVPAAVKDSSTRRLPPAPLL